MSARVPLLTLLLCAVNAALAVALGWRLMHGSQRHELVAATAQKTSLTFESLDPPAVTPVDSIQAQAIFHASRSFYVPPVETVVQPPPDYRLVGSMSIPGKPPAAVLIHSQTGERMRVAKGDQLEGWTIADVAPGRVTMQLGERSAEITTTARQVAPGMSVIVTQPVRTTSAAAPGGVRVLGGTNPSAQPVSQRATTLEAPRLYRPPPSR